MTKKYDIIKGIDDLEYTKLVFAVKEFMYALSCCYNQGFDLLDPALNLIKKYLSEYRQYASEKKLPTEQIAQKRLSVCNTLDKKVMIKDERTSL